MSATHGDQPSARVLWLCGVGCAALVAVNVWLGTAYSVDSLVAVGSEVATACAFAFPGLAAWWLRPRSRTGPWMVALGAVALVANLLDLRLVSTMPGHGLAIVIGELVFWFQYAIAGHIVLAYPTGRLAGRAERVLIATAFGVAAVTGLVTLVTLTPDPAICANWCFDSPVQLVADRQLYVAIRAVIVAVWVVLAAAAIVLLICRAVRCGPRQRRGLGWVLLAFGVAAILFAASALTVIILGLRSTATLALVYGHQWFGVLALPVVFFIGLLHQRLQFASIGVLVRRLEGATADNVEALLRATLRDPHLRVLFPVPGRWLDAAGRPCPLSPDDTRTVLPLGNPPVALLLHDPTLAEDSEVLASAASAAFLALDNARLRALAQQLADAAPVTLAAAQLSDHAIAGGPVFISYSRTDRGFVQRLAVFLTTEGIAVWFDNSIETGERFARIIQRQIDTCPAVIVVMTPAAMASEWVDIEITYAAAKRKPIMPVLLIPCEATILLAGLIWEDVTTGALPSRRFLAHLRTLIGHTTPPTRQSASPASRP